MKTKFTSSYSAFHTDGLLLAGWIQWQRRAHKTAEDKVFIKKLHAQLLRWRRRHQAELLRGPHDPLSN